MFSRKSLYKRCNLATSSYVRTVPTKQHVLYQDPSSTYHVSYSTYHPTPPNSTTASLLHHTYRDSSSAGNNSPCREKNTHAHPHSSTNANTVNPQVPHRTPSSIHPFTIYQCYTQQPNDSITVHASVNRTITKPPLLPPTSQPVMICHQHPTLHSG